MASTDSIRWNERYASNLKHPTRPASYLTEHIDLLPPAGRVLDIAMGMGRNAIFLKKHGYAVVGTDISSVALRYVRSLSPDLCAILTDMEHHCLRDRTFDICLNFYYLQRSLFATFGTILRPGGVLVFETLLMPMKKIHPEIPQAYLLQEGELNASFSDWKILHYREGWIESDHGLQKSVASLIAQLP